MNTVFLHQPGLMEYKTCWDWQEELFANTVQIKMSNRDKNISDHQIPPHHLILVEHPPVYTLGKSGKRSHILWDDNMLQEKGISFFSINRGGDITYHGPGQCVGYPILDLNQFYTDIHRYLRDLEEVIIRTLADFGIESGRVDGLTGVWIDGSHPDKARKICAMGIRASRWVTMHGWALNVNTNLSHFEGIIPCGIDDKAVTSMQKELGQSVSMEDVKAKLLTHFAITFGVEFYDSAKFPAT